MIRYRPGKKNVVVDVLSRKDTPYQDTSRQFVLLPESYFESLSTLTQVALLQVTDLIIDRVKHANKTSSELEEYREIARKGSTV
jgi:hypothetical protein